MSDSFHGRNTVLLQTHFILEKTISTTGIGLMLVLITNHQLAAVVYL